MSLKQITGIENIDTSSKDIDAAAVLAFSLLCLFIQARTFSAKNSD